MMSVDKPQDLLVNSKCAHFNKVSEQVAAVFRIVVFQEQLYLV